MVVRDIFLFFMGWILVIFGVKWGYHPMILLAPGGVRGHLGGVDYRTLREHVIGREPGYPDVWVSFGCYRT